MPILNFAGRILPISVIANFPEVPRINWGTEDLGFPIVMSLRIKDSIVEIVCEVEQFEDSHLSVLLGRAYNLAYACIDMGSFATGIGLSVELDTVVRPGAPPASIVQENPELGLECSAFRIPSLSAEEQSDFNKVLHILLADTALLGSMHDLGRMLNNFHNTPTNCGRVLDSLRKSVAPEAKPHSGWEVLKNIVNVRGEYMNWVSAYSTNPRHGDHWTPIPKEVIDEIRKRTWIVMNRLIEYRKGGNSPLDETRFPTLDHNPSFPFPTP